MGYQRGPVVVGVDGTERSVDALRWAAAEAMRRGCELLAVLAYGDARVTAPYAPVPAAGLADPPASAADKLAETVQAALGRPAAVPVRQVCDPRPPVPALLAHGADADLLVLATSPEPILHPARWSGHTAGSTALACVRHAPCPVVLLPVARPDPRATPARATPAQATPARAARAPQAPAPV